MAEITSTLTLTNRAPIDKSERDASRSIAHPRRSSTARARSIPRNAVHSTDKVVTIAIASLSVASARPSSGSHGDTRRSACSASTRLSGGDMSWTSRSSQSEVVRPVNRTSSGRASRTMIRPSGPRAFS